MRRSHAYQASFIAIAAATLMGQSAFAQTAAPAKDGASQGLEEVVVVARRVEERLQDVPVTVTAISAQTLKDTQISTGTDLIKLVPSLSVQQGATGPGVNYAIRGIRDGVVTYFNDVPVNTAVVDDQIWDLSSVQALAGPQGTLFGKTATGGAILFEAQRPTKTFGGYVDASYGNYNYEQLNAVVNIPVNDMLQLRLGGRLVKHDGFVKNTLGSDMQSENRYQFRASALFEPTSTITDYAVFDYGRRDEVPVAFISSFLVPGGLPDTIYGPGVLEAQQAQQNAFGIRKTANPFQNYDRATNYGVSNTFTDSLGHGLTFKYILGYRFTDVDYLSSKSSFAVPIFVGENGGPDQTQWTHEVQLLGKTFNDRLSWTVGLFDLQSNDPNTVNTYQLLSPAGTPFAVANNTNHFESDKASSEAAYAQATFAITDKLNLTGGVRYTRDTASFTGAATNPQFFFSGPQVCSLTPGASGVDIATCSQSQSLSSNAVTYNVSLDYHLSRNVMVYGTTRRGYNGGGFNQSAPANPPPGVPQATYLPEYVTDYEVGVKSEGTWAGVPVRANLSGYMSKYTNIQRQSIGVTSTGTYNAIGNGPKATIYGMVLESVVRPIHDLTINLNYGFLHTQYDVGAPGFPAGNTFGQAPEHTLNASGTWRHDVASGGAAVATISYAYQSQITFMDSNVGVLHYLQPAYGIVDAQAGWQSIMNSPIDVTFFVKNLTNVAYAQEMQDLSSLLAFTGTVYNDPRTFGVEVHYRFGG
jgi:iron complex outermembrane receptor protein